MFEVEPRAAAVPAAAQRQTSNTKLPTPNPATLRRIETDTLPVFSAGCQGARPGLACFAPLAHRQRDDFRGDSIAGKAHCLACAATSPGWDGMALVSHAIVLIREMAALGGWAMAVGWDSAMLVCGTNRLVCPVTGLVCTVTGLVCTVTGLVCTVTGLVCTVTGLVCTVTGLVCTVTGLVCTVTGLVCAVTGLACSGMALTCAAAARIGHAAPVLRDKLYFPALTAMCHDPCSIAFAARLRAAGKTPVQILFAVLHKLVHTAFALLKSSAAYNPNHALFHTT